MRWCSLVVVLAACGPSSVMDLDLPVVELDRNSGLCTAAIMVAADASVWTESGCEASSSGFTHVRDVPATTRDDLDAKVRAAIADAAGQHCPPPLYDAWRVASRSGDNPSGEICGMVTTGEQAFIDAMRAVGPPGF